MKMTCIGTRHYATLQCLAILDIYTTSTEPSSIATIKVQGTIAIILLNRGFLVRFIAGKCGSE